MALLKTIFLRTITVASMFLANIAHADLYIVSGGGYKKPMQALIATYTQQSQHTVHAGYGNMRQITSQARASSNIALAIGDKNFLAKTDLFIDYQTLGKGKMVIAWAQGRPAISEAPDLLKPEITRIAHPDAKKAIYGLAATQWLSHKQLTPTLNDKLIATSTIPQVSSYLVAREIDAGFINLTDAIGLEQRIGGYTELNDGYSDIEIVAAVVKNHENSPELQEFLQFLTSAQAQDILKQYGLK